MEEAAGHLAVGHAIAALLAGAECVPDRAALEPLGEVAIGGVGAAVALGRRSVEVWSQRFGGKDSGAIPRVFSCASRPVRTIPRSACFSPARSIARPSAAKAIGLPFRGG
jgi:hypothetical protein